MIGPGSLPSYKPRVSRKRPLAYVPRRRLVPPHRSKHVVHDYFPTVVPSAKIHARTTAEALRIWFGVHWAWLRPRTIPFAAALFGMLAVLQSAYYLAHQHDEAEAPYFYVEASPAGQ